MLVCIQLTLLLLYNTTSFAAANLQAYLSVGLAGKKKSAQFFLHTLLIAAITSYLVAFLLPVTPYAGISVRHIKSTDETGFAVVNSFCVIRSAAKRKQKKM